MSEVVIDVEGLELQGFHGVLEEERHSGQRFLFDVRLVAHDAATTGECPTTAIRRMVPRSLRLAWR